MNSSLLQPLSLLKKFNQWREDKLVAGFRWLLEHYQKSDPQNYAVFKNRWLQARLFNLPNFISLLRILGIIPLIYCLMLNNTFGYTWSILIFILISLTDLIDGPIAIAAKCQTSWGSTLDPLADKVLIIGVMVVQNSYFPILHYVLVNLLILGEVIFSLMRFGRLLMKIQPYGSNLFGKLKFVLQMAVVIILLFRAPLALYANFLLLMSLGLLYYNIATGSIMLLGRLSAKNKITP